MIPHREYALYRLQQPRRLPCRARSPTTSVPPASPFGRRPAEEPSSGRRATVICTHTVRCPSRPPDVHRGREQGRCCGLLVTRPLSIRTAGLLPPLGLFAAIQRSAAVSSPQGGTHQPHRALSHFRGFLVDLRQPTRPPWFPARSEGYTAPPRLTPSFSLRTSSNSLIAAPSSLAAHVYASFHPRASSSSARSSRSSPLLEPASGFSPLPAGRRLAYASFSFSFLGPRSLLQLQPPLCRSAKMDGRVRLWARKLP